MATLKPYKGLRYNSEKISELNTVMTPPYDIISEKEQKDFYEKSPYNVIRLEYGVINDDDNDQNNRYTRAAADLKAWMDEGILKKEDKDSLYVYEQVFTHNDVTYSCKGIITLVQLEEFSKGIVLPHEETLSKAKTDRFNLMSTTYSNFSQIYCLYLDEKKTVKHIIDNVSAKNPDISFRADDGILQNLWIIQDAETINAIVKGFADKQLFIADGHHRYETALNFRNKMREENPSYSPDDLFNYVMMMVVDMDDEGLLVFPTHRMVKDIENFSETDIVSKLKENFEVQKIIVSNRTDVVAKTIEYELTKCANKGKVFAFYCGGDYYYKVSLKNFNAVKELMPNKSDAYCGLDVSVLHSLILDKIFGIDTENLANQKNLTYTRSFDEAITSVKDGSFQCSFMLNATKIREIKDVSLANEKMPQKSTYFYPKLITGLVMNNFKDLD